MLNGKHILITGGTGSFGKMLTQVVLERYAPKRLIIFSRDELKQFEMQQRFPEKAHPCIRYFIGDVRDKDRLVRAFAEVDIVVHAAALKQVPACEYNPFEAVKTNVLGAQNIIDAAIDRGVKKIIALSTDKAANPINLYGATKLCSDKLFISANAYVGTHDTAFSVVRYGNVMGSRGSVVPFFLNQRSRGVIPITDARMTRFWITLQQGVDFVLSCLDVMGGGELFVPKIPSMKITALAEALAPGCRQEIVGIRPGEKIHEVLVPEDEARNAIELEDRFVVLPGYTLPGVEKWLGRGTACPDNFRYASDTNDRWLSANEMHAMLADTSNGNPDSGN